MAGKGDKQRPCNLQKYAENYERIFGDKGKKSKFKIRLNSKSKKKESSS